MQNRLPIAAGLDMFVVIAFVAIGRRNHDENPGLAGLVDTAAPFVLGLVLAVDSRPGVERPVEREDRSYRLARHGCRRDGAP